MRAFWHFWVELFGQQEEGTSLALFRIALGMVTLYSLLSVAAAGLVGPLWTDVSYGGMRSVGGNWLVQWLGGPGPQVMWTLWGVALAATLAFTVGLGGAVVGRLIALVMLQSYNGLATCNPLTSGGYDALMSNAMWLMVFAEPAATMSVRARLRGGTWCSSALVSAWPRYVLIFQVLLMYSLTGLQKTAHIWTPGGGYTALYWVSQDLGWTRYDVGQYAAWLTPILRIGTAMTWHWEQLSLLLMVWFYYRYTASRAGRFRQWILRRDLRAAWAIVGVGLHVGILLFMNVGPFSWISLSYYLLMWNPQEWATLGKRLGERYRRRWPGKREPRR